MGDILDQRPLFLSQVNGEYSYLGYSLIHRCLVGSLSTMVLLTEREGQELNNISKNFEDDVLEALTRGKNYRTVSTTLTDIFNRIKEVVAEVRGWWIDENGRLQGDLFGLLISDQLRRGGRGGEDEENWSMVVELDLDEGMVGKSELDEGRRLNDLHDPPTPLFDFPLDKEDKKEERVYERVIIQGKIVNVATASAPFKPTPPQTTKGEPTIEPREANLTAFASPVAAKAAEENARKAREKAIREAEEQAAKAEAEKKARGKELKD
jgi:hypothetical protein